MLASGIALGIAAGWLVGGRFSRLADTRLSWWPLLAVAVLLRLVAPSLGEPLVAWLASFATITTVALLNWRTPGMLAIAMGATMNLVVVLVNGAMPVDGPLARSIGVHIEPNGLHRELRDDDSLTMLADRIPVPFLPRMYSVGDVFLAIGGFWVPFARMRRA